MELYLLIVISHNQQFLSFNFGNSRIHKRATKQLTSFIFEFNPSPTSCSFPWIGAPSICLYPTFNAVPTPAFRSPGLPSYVPEANTEIVKSLFNLSTVDPTGFDIFPAGMFYSI